ILVVIALIALAGSRAQGGGGNAKASGGCPDRRVCEAAERGRGDDSQPPEWVASGATGGSSARVPLARADEPPVAPSTGWGNHASPDHRRTTHSVVSSSVTSASVHHDRRSGAADSNSRTAARDA